MEKNMLVDYRPQRCNDVPRIIDRNTLIVTAAAWISSQFFRLHFIRSLVVSR